MRIGIIGSGQIAKIHCPLILNQPETKIVGIADKDLARAQFLAADLGVEHYYEDALHMIEQQKPDLVHVLTPPEYHAKLSIMAMNQGCHVLVEKPMALNLQEAKEMARVAEEQGVRLCVNHSMVFDHTVQKALDLASKGFIGRIVAVEVNYSYDARRNPALLEEGAEYCHWSYRLTGGILQDLMPHPASVVIELLPNFNDVKSIGQNCGLLPRYWDDEIRVIVKSNDRVGYISVSVNEKPDCQILYLKGTKGTIQADLFGGMLVVRRKSPLPRSLARGLSGFQLAWQYFKGSIQNVYGFVTGQIDKSGGIEPLITKFYESIRNDTAFPGTLEKSVRVMDLIARVWPEPPVARTSLTPPRYTSKSGRSQATALVTGASGFIGYHLVKKLLAEGMHVRAFVRQNSIHAGRLANLNIDIVESDLTNRDALCDATKGIEIVFHAGFPMGAGKEESEKIGVEGTKMLVENALTNKVRRFIYLSSLTVYDLLTNSESTIKEDHSYQNKTHKMGPYAWAKIETEKVLLDVYKRQGLEIAIVRPGIVFGPLGPIFYPHLGYRYQDAVFFLLGKHDTILPLTYVENTVDAIYRTSVTDKSVGQAYNIVDDGEVTPKTYLKQFQRITGKPIRIVHLPYVIPYTFAAVFEIAAGMGLFKENRTSRAQLKYKHRRVTFDNTKAKVDLAWRPKISINEGLERTFKWYAAKYLF